MADRASIDFTLNPPGHALPVHVRLHRAGDRWVARATARGEVRIGLAASARQAVSAALAPLGPATVASMLADVRLWEVSRKVVEAEAATAP